MEKITLSLLLPLLLWGCASAGGDLSASSVQDDIRERGPAAMSLNFEAEMESIGNKCLRVFRAATYLGLKWRACYGGNGCFRFDSAGFRRCQGLAQVACGSLESGQRRSFFAKQCLHRPLYRAGGSFGRDPSHRGERRGLELGRRSRVGGSARWVSGAF